VYSLSVGAQYVQTGKYRTVLCVGAECLSVSPTYTDRGTLHPSRRRGGGGGAPAAEDETGIIDTDLYSTAATGSCSISPAAGAAEPRDPSEP
jgi:3-oxoacyl-[acyl-carrier-protein] synthase-3